MRNVIIRVWFNVLQIFTNCLSSSILIIILVKGCYLSIINRLLWFHFYLQRNLMYIWLTVTGVLNLVFVIFGCLLICWGLLLKNTHKIPDIIGIFWYWFYFRVLSLFEKLNFFVHFTLISSIKTIGWYS